MKQVPKYVIKMLEKRSRLSRQLRNACIEVDRYCEKIGVDFNDPDAALMTDIRIYCEEDGALFSTLKAIERALGIMDEGEERSGNK